MDAFISYEGLPLNAGGAHGLGKQPPENIFAATLHFLENFTIPVVPVKIQLQFYSSLAGAYKTLPAVWHIGKAFGLPAYGNWALKNQKQHYYQWKVRRAKTTTAFQLLNHFSSLPDNEYGPLVLSFFWHFKFVDPVTKAPLKGQEEIPVIDERQQNSQLFLRLGSKSTISAWLAFPFGELNDKNKEYLQSVVNKLPFTASDKHWRLWRKSAKGEWYPRTLQINGD